MMNENYPLIGSILQRTEILSSHSTNEISGHYLQTVLDVT